MNGVSPSSVIVQVSPFRISSKENVTSSHFTVPGSSGVPVISAVPVGAAEVILTTTLIGELSSWTVMTSPLLVAVIPACPFSTPASC